MTITRNQIIFSKKSYFPSNFLPQCSYTLYISPELIQTTREHEFLTTLMLKCPFEFTDNNTSSLFHSRYNLDLII